MPKSMSEKDLKTLIGVADQQKLEKALSALEQERDNACELKAYYPRATVEKERYRLEQLFKEIGR